jgi:hypothetical protein
MSGLFSCAKNLDRRASSVTSRMVKFDPPFPISLRQREKATTGDGITRTANLFSPDCGFAAVVAGASPPGGKTEDAQSGLGGPWRGWEGRGRGIRRPGAGRHVAAFPEPRIKHLAEVRRRDAPIPGSGKHGAGATPRWCDRWWRVWAVWRGVRAITRIGEADLRGSGGRRVVCVTSGVTS